MSNTNNSEPVIDFDRGELVRIRMTPELCGQVIGEKDWGKSFLVRLGGTTEAFWFENVELETYESAESASGFGREEEPPKSKKGTVKAAAIDNVINLAERRALGGMQ